MLRLFPLALLAAVTLAACDATSGGDQNRFEDQAYLTPPGTASGWPIGPAFDARYEVTPPAPNPARYGEFVTLQLFASVGVPGGFALYRLYPSDGTLELITSLPGDNRPTFYTLGFDAQQVDPLGRSGTYRLLVLDGNRRVVTYGDFTLQS